jgi:hypothetical protein
LNIQNARPNPGFAPLCARCGTAAEAQDHPKLCLDFEERPDLWAQGWVDLQAFGLPPEVAEGWPEVVEGPIAVVVEGGLGPDWIISRRGPWVRADGDGPTHRRVAAFAVLCTAGRSPLEAVAMVLAADTATLEEWCAPTLEIDTAGCGRKHHVKIERGVATAPNHNRAASHLPGPALCRLKTSATCRSFIERWDRADMGQIQGDLTAGPVPRYFRIGHNPAVFDAFRIFTAATLARARVQFIEANEPDRWLDLAGEPAPIDCPGGLRESTRPLPIALVWTPPTWLWSGESLVSTSPSPGG